ncbi:hypothetical protein Ocin01_06643 [Orchesella cincta]|uniref:Uncharacterized protein n=1 Tax=Orchesella cincta TaxID=48709 RepID=A0A1D2N449_ORCCI|nr:hypothetical protein Ocin01_06643 [Orchesella cincta]
MSSPEVISNRVKELEEENKILKQLLITRDSSALWHKTRMDIRLILERLTKELIDFNTKQIVWGDKSDVLFDTTFRPGQETAHLLDEWKLILGKYKRAVNEKAALHKRVSDAGKALQKKELEWIDPCVDQFVFSKNMTPKQRKKLIKKCKKDDEIAIEAKANFDALLEEWEVIYGDLQDCIDQLENIREP